MTAYLIALACLQPMVGNLGDKMGRRRPILGGLTWFGVASLGAALAPSLPVPLMLPNGVALVQEFVPTGRRASGYGLVWAATALAAAAGPPLGGLLVGAAGWRAIFYVNLPLVLPALLLGLRVISAKLARQPKAPFDLAGALLLSVVLLGVAGLLGGLLSGVLLLPVSGGVAGIALFFVWRELRHPCPVLQPHFFRSRVFVASNATVALSNLAMYTALLTIPLLLSRRAGWTSSKVGFMLAGMSAGMVLLAPFGGLLAGPCGRRAPTVAGLALFTLGLLPFALFGGGIEFPALLFGICTAGAGLGLSVASLAQAC